MSQCGVEELTPPWAQTPVLQQKRPLGPRPPQLTETWGRGGFGESATLRLLKLAGAQEPNSQTPELIWKTENDKKPMTSKEQCGSWGSK